MEKRDWRAIHDRKMGGRGRGRGLGYRPKPHVVSWDPQQEDTLAFMPETE